MSVNTTSNAIPYAGNGSSNTFPFPYPFEENSDIVCQILDNSVQSVTTLNQGTDYVVTGAGVPTGGTVSTTVPPTPTQTLLITRILPLLQESVYDPNAGVPTGQLNADLDRLVMIAQQFFNSLSKAIVGSPFDSPTLNLQLPVAGVRASQLMGFDAFGNVATYVPSTNGTIDPFGSQQFAVATLAVVGSVNTYSLTLPSFTAPPQVGQRISIQTPNTANVSGTIVLSINGALSNVFGGTLAAGTLLANTVYELLYSQISGTGYWFILNQNSIQAPIANSSLATMPTFTIKGNNTGSSATPSDLTVAQVQAMLAPSFTAPVVGSMRNLVGANVSSGGGNTQSANWTCEELIAETSLGGTAFKGVSLTLTFNGGTTGAGGMDTGTLTGGINLYIYAIYNPTTNTWNTLGSTSSNSVYNGGHMPAGYTASCLIWAGVTDVSQNIQAFNQMDRDIYFPKFNVLASGSATSYTSVSLTGIVPAKAKKISGTVGAPSSSAYSIAVASTSTGTAEFVAICNGQSALNLDNFAMSTPFSDLPLVVTQTLYYKNSMYLARIDLNKYSI